MKLLYLSSVLVVPSELGEKKIEKALSKKGNNKKDDYNRNAEWYEDMNLPIPDYLKEDDLSEIDSEGNILLRDEEMEWTFMDCVIKLSDFSSCIDNQQIGSVIYTKHGDELHVQESAEDIFSYINYLTRPWHERLTDSIKSKWLRIRYFWRKKVDYKDIMAMAENQPDYIKPTE